MVLMIEGRDRERAMKSKKIIDPTRIRTHEGSFSYIPHRFLRGGFFASCTAAELCVYLLLVLAADTQGVSFYSRERMSALCKFSIDRIEEALRGLERKDLIACDGMVVQVLSLPEGSVREGKAHAGSGAVSVRDALHAFALHLEGRVHKQGI